MSSRGGINQLSTEKDHFTILHYNSDAVAVQYVCLIDSMFNSLQPLELQNYFTDRSEECDHKNWKIVKPVMVGYCRSVNE